MNTGGDLPTLDEVHDAIDLIGELFKKYGHLLTGGGWASLTPVLQHDWEAVFRIPWITERPLPEPMRKGREWQEERKALE